MLPTLENDFSYVKTQLPSGKSIGIRGWKVKDEKELLFALDSADAAGEELFKIKQIISFLKNCVDNKNIYDQLSESDIKVIATDIRKLSKGDTIDYTFVCSNAECKNHINDRISLTESTTVKNFDATAIKVNDRLTITFADISYTKAFKVYEEYGNISATKYAFYYMLNSIDSVTVDGETYTEFPIDELEANIIDQLSSTDMANLSNNFTEKSSNVKLEKKATCIKCKTETTVDFPDILSFLAL